MYTALIILLTLIGYSLLANLIVKAASDIRRYKACLDILKIKYDCFPSVVNKDLTGIYIEDKQFNNTILYFDKKGKLVGKDAA